MKKFMRRMGLLSLIFLVATLLSFLINDLPSLQKKAKQNQNRVIDELFVRIDESDVTKYKRQVLDPFTEIDLQGNNMEVWIEKGEKCQLVSSNKKILDNLTVKEGKIYLDAGKKMTRLHIIHPNPRSLFLNGRIGNGSLEVTQSLKEAKIDIGNGGCTIRGEASFPLSCSVGNGNISLNIDRLDAKVMASVDVGSIEIFKEEHEGVGLHKITKTFGGSRDFINLTVGNGEIEVE